MASFCGFLRSYNKIDDNDFLYDKCLVSPVSDQLSASSSSVSLCANDSQVSNNNERTPILQHVRFVYLQYVYKYPV